MFSLALSDQTFDSRRCRLGIIQHISVVYSVSLWSHTLWLCIIIFQQSAVTKTMIVAFKKLSHGLYLLFDWL